MVEFLLFVSAVGWTFAWREHQRRLFAEALFANPPVVKVSLPEIVVPAAPPAPEPVIFVFEPTRTTLKPYTHSGKVVETKKPTDMQAHHERIARIKKVMDEQGCGFMAAAAQVDVEA